jgi:hypothetical protein
MEKRINQIHNAIEQVDSGRFARVPAAGIRCRAPRCPATG